MLQMGPLISLLAFLTLSWRVEQIRHLMGAVKEKIKVVAMGF